MARLGTADRERSRAEALHYNGKTAGRRKHGYEELR
jgi:hypothetical protein